MENYQNWGPDYKVEFKIKVTESNRNDPLNVFRLTSTENDCCNHGDRIIYFMITTDNHFQIRSAMFNFPIFPPPPEDIKYQMNGIEKNISFEIGKEYNVTIRQYETTDTFIYAYEVKVTEINNAANEQRHNIVIGPYPLTHTNVKFYAGDNFNNVC